MRRKGFIMLEAGISLILVGLFSCYLTAWYLHIICIEELLTERVKTLLLAQSLLEKYRAGHDRMGLKEDGYILRWNIQADTLIPRYEHVSLTIMKVNGKNNPFTIKTGFEQDEARSKLN